MPQTMTEVPQTLTTVALPAVAEEQLDALCALWQAEERSVWMTLHGGSMTPTILPGTRFCLHCGGGIPPLGSIVAYRLGRVLAVHRLIEVAGPPENPRLICLGDGNISPDLPVPASALLGTVSLVKPQPLWRHIVFALRHPRRYARCFRRRSQG